MSAHLYFCYLSNSCRPDISGVSVKQVVVATTHFVLLTDDGHIYKIPYSLASDTKEKRCGLILCMGVVSFY